MAPILPAPVEQPRARGGAVFAGTERLEPQYRSRIRVSSIQTGCFAGARGSEVGQHRFTPRLVVREEQPLIAHYTPLYGRIETRLKAVAIPGYMVAMWMIGFEREPSQSAEICICEIFGSDVNRGTAMVGYRVHPFADPAIRDEFYRDAVEMDATQFHVYAIDWTPDHIEFSLDGSPLRRISQSPDYPMQLMLGIYEIPAQITEASAPGLWPKTLEVDYVRGYRATRATPGPDRR